HQTPAAGAGIPQLAELFALGRQPGAEPLTFCIELKVSPLTPERTIGPEDFAQRVVAAVRDGRMERRSSILSFDWRALSAARRAAPDIPVVCLTAQQSWMNNIFAGAGSSPWTAPLHVGRFGGSLPRMVHAAGGSAWAPYYEELTPSLL